MKSRDKPTVKSAFENPIKQANRSQGILAKLFWNIVANYGITYSTWTRTLRGYVVDPMNVPEQTAARRSEARNNLGSAIINKNPTFLQWIRAIKANDIRRIRITVETWRGDDEEYVKVSLDQVLKHTDVSPERADDEPEET